MAREMTATLAVAAEIRAELARQQLTTAWLADQIGVDPTSMRRKVSGARRLTIDDAVRSAEALGIPLMRLFGAEPRAAA